MAMRSAKAEESSRQMPLVKILLPGGKIGASDGMDENLNRRIRSRKVLFLNPLGKTGKKAHFA
jgi:hypothetical protein